jgi:hypothetical protein
MTMAATRPKARWKGRNLDDQQTPEVAQPAEDLLHLSPLGIRKASMTAVSAAGSGTGRGIHSMMTVSGMMTHTVGQEATAKAKKPKTNKLKESHPLLSIPGSQSHFRPLDKSVKFLL